MALKSMTLKSPDAWSLIVRLLPDERIKLGLSVPQSVLPSWLEDVLWPSKNSTLAWSQSSFGKSYLEEKYDKILTFAIKASAINQVLL